MSFLILNFLTYNLFYVVMRSMGGPRRPRSELQQELYKILTDYQYKIDESGVLKVLLSVLQKAQTEMASDSSSLKKKHLQILGYIKHAIISAEDYEKAVREEVEEDETPWID